MSEANFRQTVTSRAVYQYMGREGLSLREMASRLSMSVTTLHNRLHGRRRWTADELDLLVLLGVEVPALGMPEAVGA